MLYDECAFCGQCDERYGTLGGANATICFKCLADAFKAVSLSYLASQDLETEGTLAIDRGTCLICAQPEQESQLLAFRGIRCICGDCLKKAFKLIVDDGAQPRVPF